MPTNQLKAVPTQISTSKDIVDHILNNDIVLQSSEMLHKLLKKYPDEPGIVRV